MKPTRSHAGAGAPTLSDTHSDKERRTTIGDLPIFPGTILPQPMNQESEDTDSADLEGTSPVTDECSDASDPECLFPNEEESESDREGLSYLCKRCRKIDFDSIFSRRQTRAGGGVILRFDSEHKVFMDERCSFCQAMRFIHPSLDILPDWKKRSSPLIVATYQDKGVLERGASFPSVQDVTEDNICLTFGSHEEPSGLNRRIFLWAKENYGENMFFGSMSHDGHELVGYLAGKRTVEANRNIFPASSVKHRVNFGMINKRLEECREKHERCRKKRARNMPKIPGMRLIDCRTWTVVPAPNGDVSYAALSYVWGDSRAANFESGFIIEEPPGKLPESLPNTISDAMLVTRKLNIRYLWIDRYCIRQIARTKEEKDEKHEQIARMHQIYGGASITIIAAAGNGPDHGLPGVRTKRRPPTVRLTNLTVFATLPDPKLLLDASVWSTRGWTFQEGLLARRVLVFTDQQVYFQCGEAAEAEAWENRLEEAMFRIPYNRHTPLAPYFKLGYSYTPSVWPKIHDYVKLTMRDPQDILNGILGVLAYYEWMSDMRHVTGLPLERCYSDFISWPQRFSNALCWECDEPGERRPGFPTWSWTGWTCKGFDRNDGWYRIPPGIVREWSISIETAAEESADQSDLVTVLNGGHDLSQVKFLRVTAPSLEAEIIPVDGRPEKQRYWTVTTGMDIYDFDNNEQLLGVRYSGDEGVSSFNLTDSKWLKSPLPCGKIRCFALIMDEDHSDIRDDQFGDLSGVVLDHVTALIVIEMEDVFERIGVSGLDREKLKQMGSVVREFRLM